MRLTLFVLCASLAGPAVASDSKSDEAKKHFSRGKELYADGDFPGALNELERAYAAVPNFKLLYNIGQLQAQLQNYAMAIKSLRRFLLDAGSDISDARRAEVLKDIDKFRTRVAELTIVTAEGAEVAVDDVVVGVSPLAEPVTVNVGRRKVTATIANHFPVTKYLEVVGLDALSVKLVPQPMVSGAAGSAGATRAPAPAQTAAPSAAPQVTAEPAAPARLPVWVPWVGTAALGAATGVMAALSLQASNEQKTLLGTYGVTRAQLNTAGSRTRTHALVTDILAGCTAAAAIGSLLFTILRTPDAPPALTFGVSTNQVVVSGSF
jgi:hypothetical protein